MRTFGVVLIIVCSLSGALCDNNETFTYGNEEDGPVKSVDSTLPVVKCFDCSFFERGTNLEGNELCKEMNSSSTGVPTEVCQGYCVKDLMESAFGYTYVSRYCLNECEEGPTERYGMTLKKTCCTEPLCNSSGALWPSLGGVMALLSFGFLLKY